MFSLPPRTGVILFFVGIVLLPVWESLPIALVFGPTMLLLASAFFGSWIAERTTDYTRFPTHLDLAAIFFLFHLLT